VSDLLVGLLGALLATNQPAAVSNLITKHTGLTVAVANPNDPVEQEYQQLLARDDAAQAEVDRWIRADRKTMEKAGADPTELQARIKLRFGPIRAGYEDFLGRHPNHVRARIAYGSFLNDLGDEQAALAQWEKARDADPKEPAVWNNLANYYGHNGQPKQAFTCYDKAIELSPRQSVYYENLATIMYLFRTEAKEHYDLAEPQVFNRVMALYRKALAYDPQNFELATELAQTYYGFKPPRTKEVEEDLRAETKHYEEALEAWRVALKLARDDLEREGVYLHLARINLMAGRTEEARRNLGLVTNATYTVVKERLEKNVVSREGKAYSAPPVSLRP
jgi:tetratricopeptide (TPR) repeat protein